MIEIRSAEVSEKYSTSRHFRLSSAGKPGRLRSVRSGYRVNRKQKHRTRDPRTKPTCRGVAAISVVMEICHAVQAVWWVYTTMLWIVQQIGWSQCHNCFFFLCFRTEEEKREAARRLEEWREERRRKKELEEEWRLAETIQRRRQAKVKCVVSYLCVFLAVCWCRCGAVCCCLHLIWYLTFPLNDVSVRKSGAASSGWNSPSRSSTGSGERRKKNRSGGWESKKRRRWRRGEE